MQPILKNRNKKTFHRNIRLPDECGRQRSGGSHYAGMKIQFGANCGRGQYDFSEYLLGARQCRTKNLGKAEFLPEYNKEKLKPGDWNTELHSRACG
ncbi:hypothetical protein [Mariniphaga sp.]|uniref:hypothetical protein n=1 Tax=Mariniphaga sp. TaxID=1954475 RepID=UPI00356A84DE